MTSRVARNNVIFEIGLFIGGLGRERVFIVTPQNTGDFRIPSDLPYGIRTFDSVLRTSAMVNPAAIVANRAHPALIVLGPGGL
jgi:hypothetical protein